MAGRLLEQIGRASETITGALREANEPAFLTTTLDPDLVKRLQAAVTAVDRALAEASAEERSEACLHPAYAEYKDRLVQLHNALSLWQNRLLARRAELDKKTERVSAARRWAEAYNSTH
ncbi:MAG: hypothetical protein KGL59_11870 [Acidobacteriota bacterium]|nr:hypothetical protein [Acidobacteriota bacterium]